MSLYKDELFELYPDVPKDKLESAMGLVSGKLCMSEDDIAKLCVMNKIMGGLELCNIKNLPINGTDVLEFLRNLYRFGIIKDNKNGKE